jgi:hypothetical protein
MEEEEDDDNTFSMQKLYITFYIYPMTTDYINQAYFL